LDFRLIKLPPSTFIQEFVFPSRSGMTSVSFASVFIIQCCNQWYVRTKLHLSVVTDSCQNDNAVHNLSTRN